MATIRHREGRGYSVAWKEPEVTVTSDGRHIKRWRQREQACPNLATATRLKVKVEEEAALGRRWVDQRTNPVATIGAVVEAFIDASAQGNPRTSAFRASTLQRFYAFAGHRPVVDLGSELLLGYHETLVEAGIRTATRYVSTVEQAWRWAKRHPNRFPGVPDVEGVVGEELSTAPPRVSIDTPTWADVDKMILLGLSKSAKHRFHQRVAIVQRYTGLRVSQILHLKREDIDPERGLMVLRADSVGAKGADRDTSVPIHGDLANAVKGWDHTDGYLFARVATKGRHKGKSIVPRGDEVAEVFTAAWKRAGVPESRWGRVGRDHARPTNAIRALWKSTISGAAGYEMAALMVGQSAERPDHWAYVAMGNPEASPYWTRMRAALASIPTLRVGEIEENQQSDFYVDEEEG